MDIQAKKLNLIDRLMKIRKASILQRFEELLMQSEMDDQAEASMQDIKEGKVKPYNQFKQEATEWIKSKKSTKS
jgi:hypothetical protein